ncbi:MAG TPA: hypothetical protein VHC69_35980 [Polyangiaceae bacterium]|nr:hypothetical protein [Polyangiaceae bacterium]
MKRSLHTYVFAAMFAAIPGCSSWPGVSKNPGGSVNSTPNSPTGTCSGTPLPCNGLNGADCFSSSGCMDLGNCQGTATDVGGLCGVETSYQGCVAVAGCFWAPNCMGTPLGTCSGTTEAQCLLAKGCSFTPEQSDTGTGGTTGSSTTCKSYAAVCSGNSSCDCGYGCVTQCATCKAVCGIACLSDLDCIAAEGPNGATPYCTGVTNPPTVQFPGLCADARNGQ